MNEDLISELDISNEKIEKIIEQEKWELDRREDAYRGDRERIELTDKVVILVDDGLATGASMRAAVKAVKSENPKKTIVAVPTAPPETCEEIRQYADEVICVRTPTPFRGVGAWYEDFPQVDDQQVRDIMKDAEKAYG
jgi:putative phosphoribosyl transferase